ncbi:MAG: carboxymuconolactone decarboxylase family protein [Candidatus Poribacteria bacterium]|nr:carboxymuconolactone decarboxylase family protein [Candidatus Poribacteria bacterium]
MAWIRTVPESEATGIVKEEYDTSIKRAGRIYNIVKLFSIKPESLKAFIHQYQVVMLGPSKLSRAQREMIATVVSRINACRY